MTTLTPNIALPCWRIGIECRKIIEGRMRNEPIPQRSTTVPGNAIGTKSSPSGIGGKLNHPANTHPFAHKYIEAAYGLFLATTGCPLARIAIKSAGCWIGRLLPQPDDCTIIVLLNSASFSTLETQNICHIYRWPKHHLLSIVTRGCLQPAPNWLI
jgi:hypothetical protein